MCGALGIFFILPPVLYIGANSGNLVAMLQKTDPRLAALGRCRHVWETRRRLHYPDAVARLKAIALAEERVLNGEAPVKVKPPRVIRDASPACRRGED